jgi:hypothetical protein
VTTGAFLDTWPITCIWIASVRHSENGVVILPLDADVSSHGPGFSSLLLLMRFVADESIVSLCNIHLQYKQKLSSPHKMAEVCRRVSCEV